MALQPCRECGRHVSTKAATCPHCGVPSPASSVPLNAPGPTSTGATVLRWIFVLWTLLWGGMWAVSCTQVVRAPEPGNETAAGFALIIGAFIYFGIWFVGSAVLYLIRKMVVD